MPANHPARADLQSIREAAKRATRLTRQLLVFSRSQARSPAKIEPAFELAHLASLLARLAGKNVNLVIETDKDCPAVYLHGAHFEHATSLSSTMSQRSARWLAACWWTYAAAKAAIEDLSRHYDVVLGDSVLAPGLGTALLELARTTRPKARLCAIAAVLPSREVGSALRRTGAVLVSKPFDRATLIAAVNGELSSSPGATSMRL